MKSYEITLNLSPHELEVLILRLLILLYIVVLFRTAWVAEDAYITFRTVDNFVNGRGLTWNTDERVQAYTNPLWMLLMSALYFFTREVSYTSMFLSIAVSLVAVFLFAYGIAKNRRMAIFGVTTLVFSKAFIDYSTSGLENPLTHLILAVFLIVYFKSKINERSIFILSLITAVGMVNRMDTILLFAPALLYCFMNAISEFRNNVFTLKLGELKKGVVSLLAGFTPFILWEVFSILYYGFPFPNTAYAKLMPPGVSHLILLKYGINYLVNSLHVDTPTLPFIVIVTLFVLYKRNPVDLTVVCGIILYLFYTVIIGGDFMSGRFLAAPLFCAAAVLSHQNLFSSRKTWSIAVLILVIIGLISPYPPILSGGDYGAKSDHEYRYLLISDERSLYYQHTGLLKDRKYSYMANLGKIWAEDGRRARVTNTTPVVFKNIGLFGFNAGPKIHVVDYLGIVDPLLARLPATTDNKTQIGHFERKIPTGYIETLKSGKNAIKDPDLAEYYDKLSLITRGKILDKKRLTEIWNMNTGKYNHLIESYVENQKKQNTC